MKPTEKNDRLLWVTVTAICLATFFADWVTALGYAVWSFYFIAVGMTLFQSKKSVPYLTALFSTILVVIGSIISPKGLDVKYAYVNRTIGVISYWAMAWVVAHAVSTRARVNAMLWLQQAQNALADSVRGDKGPGALADSAMAALCERLAAPVGVLYRLEANELHLVGGHAVPGHVRHTLPAGEGVLGAVIQSNSVMRVSGLDNAHLSVETALGESRPAEILAAPLTAEGKVVGVIELGRLQSPTDDATSETLLANISEVLGMAVRATFVRQQLVDLLEETQRQSEELQAQQEELRVANEELEEQSRGLQQAQVSLENQQAELEQSNVQLEERTHELEVEKEALVKSRNALAKSASELASASRYKTEFLANMSHELRTPLNSSLILAKLLTDNKPGNLNEEQLKYAKAIHDSNTDLLNLINDILDLSRIEAGHVELVADRIDTNALVTRLKETFEPLAQQKNIAIDFHVKSVPANLIGDSQRLQQILKNLLANAIKFTEVGRVDLTIDACGNDELCFSVRDTGIGIAQEHIDNVFEAFRQADGSTSRRFGGTGLGLSISRDLARRMGGTLTATSELGRGSEFLLRIPVDGTAFTEQAAVDSPVAPPPVAKAATAAAPTDSPAPALVEDDRHHRAQGRRLILAVEDDARFAEALVGLAHEMSFDCIVAPNTDEAMALIAEHEPSGILLDLNLPDGSGLTVLERLKRDPATRHIPVHVVSSLERDQRAMELGAVGYLMKPATRESLLDAMRHLEQRSQQAMRKLLIVEDDDGLRGNLQLLLARENLDIVAVGSVADATAALSETRFDCVVTDLVLSDGSGYDLLEQMATDDGRAYPPVIVYTGRALSKDDEQKLRRYSKSIILKGARSPERLLDEVTLFLHSVEASLPSNQQRLLQEARRRDAILDGRTILLAEDDVRNIFALSSVLEPLGVKLELARNGREALDRLATLNVDLVLMDIMMPEMDGIEAMQHIRRQPKWKDLPIIALTAKAMQDDRTRCLEAGANDYIAKPIDVDKLVSLCRVWCAGR